MFAVLLGGLAVPLWAQGPKAPAEAEARRAPQALGLTPVGPDTGRPSRIEPVVLTATRTERRLSALPLPVAVIPAAQIRQMGSMRAGEVLAELPGAALVQNQFGQGLQLQGFDPDYTLILLDGEPVIGRTAGTLNLTRLLVHDLERIEVIKGPASSLYGSEALGGVVNLITRGVTEPLSLGARLRTGSNATTDLTLDGAARQGRVWGRLLFNRNASAGYDLTPDTDVPTIGAHQAYTVQGKLGYDLSSRTQLTLSGRLLTERQQTRFPFSASTADVAATVADWTVLPTLVTYLRPTLRWRTSLYAAQYATTDTWRQGDVQVDANRFTQTFLRPESQLDLGYGTRSVFTLGLGGFLESVNSSRYTSLKRFQSGYAYAQADLSPRPWLGVVAGARFDAHSQYGARLSPKLALRADLSSALTLKASVGVGFKAPDFRQLFLNFTNLSAAYSVYGTEEAVPLLQAALAAGQLSALTIDPARLADLRAERSTAYQLGLTWRHGDRLVLNVGGFWHEVSDLIESISVAQRSTGQQIFSYTNLGSIVIRGAEADVLWQAAPGLSLSAGYQLLFAQDREVLSGIADGNYFLATRRMRSADYLGLYNRSRHMGTLKAFYQHPRWGTGASARLILRGSFVLADGNGNGVADIDDPRVPGHGLLNLTLNQRFDPLGVPGLELQAGLENALGFTSPTFLPGIAGRLWFLALNYRFSRT